MSQEVNIVNDKYPFVSTFIQLPERKIITKSLDYINIFNPLELYYWMAIQRKLLKEGVVLHLATPFYGHLYKVTEDGVSIIGGDFPNAFKITYTGLYIQTSSSWRQSVIVIANNEIEAIHKINSLNSDNIRIDIIESLEPYDFEKYKYYRRRNINEKIETKNHDNRIRR